MSNTPKKATAPKKQTRTTRTARPIVAQSEVPNVSETLRNTEERPSFIVQNIGSGYHVVSDIGLEFGPGDAIDLTWWDPAVIRRSSNLKKALMSGQLIQIEEDDHDELIRENLILEDEEARSSDNDARRRSRKMQVGEKEVQAEVLNLSKADGKARGAGISSYGMDNDPQSYAKAFDIAQADAKAAGSRLTARSFKTMVEHYARQNPNSPGLVRQIIDSGGQGSMSGDPSRGRATVRVANTANGGPDVLRFNMTNYNRDQQIAGATENNMAMSSRNRDDLYTDLLDDELDLEDVGEVDAIDLAFDDDESEEAFDENERSRVRRAQ